MNPAMFPQIAALLAARQGQGAQPPAASPPAAPKAAYYGTIPEIAEARKVDPRQLISNTLMSNGASTAPVAGGSWAWADGLARALSGVAGGYINRENDKKYSEYESKVGQAVKTATETAAMPQATPPAPVAPPQQQQIAAALAGPQSFDQAFAPFSDALPPSAPVQPPSGPVAVGAAPSAYAPSRTPLAAPTASPATPRRGSVANQGGAPVADVSTLFTKGILQGGERSRPNADGTYATSWKGARGPAQVMPGTAPEAARLAGLPWNEKLYNSNTAEGNAYNLKLGEAYFKAQLDTFGDPAKAAAAYNAGPAAVKRAERRASRSGGEWVDYLPKTYKDGKVVDTTANYVQRFLSSVGGATTTASSSGTVTNENVAAVGPTPVASPQYEDVPELGQANYVPPEVESNRIRIAQELMKNGDPSLVFLARSYLDQGLTEQNDARMQRNSQQFSQGANERAFEVDNRNRREDRNFGREENFTQNTFTANENAANRQQQANIAGADRAFTREERIASQTFEAEQAAIARKEERDSRMSSITTKNPFFDTVGGRKLADDMYKEIEQYDGAIGKFERALQLLDKGMQTGSIYSVPGSELIAGGLNSDVGEFSALANDTTLQKIGGSLGTAVSDGDRAFISASNIAMSTDEGANRNIAEATIGALKRKQDYLYARLNAEMAGADALRAFTNNWRAFAEATAIVQYDKNGNVSKVTRNPVKYEDWLASRPRYDANGNRMN